MLLAEVGIYQNVHFVSELGSNSIVDEYMGDRFTSAASQFDFIIKNFINGSVQIWAIPGDDAHIAAFHNPSSHGSCPPTYFHSSALSAHIPNKVNQVEPVLFL